MDLSKASGRKLQRSRRDAFRYCLQISVSVGIFMVQLSDSALKTYCKTCCVLFRQLYFVMTYFSAEGASNYCIQEAPALTLAQQRLVTLVSCNRLVYHKDVLSSPCICRHSPSWRKVVLHCQSQRTIRRPRYRLRAKRCSPLKSVSRRSISCTLGSLRVSEMR